MNRLANSSIGKSLLTGLLVTFLLLFVKCWAEHTALCQGIQRASYSWLQSELTPPNKSSELGIAIVDIRKLEYATVEVKGETFPVTPRKPLMELIEAIVAQKPAAVGIDIDFSPNKFGYADLDDPKYFRQLLELREKTGIPIFLGVNRFQNKKPELWLGSPEFASLAANIDNPEDNRKMFAWTATDSSDQKGLTMSTALKNAVSPAQAPTSKTTSWLVNQVTEGHTKRGLAAGEILVDFSVLDALRDNRLTTINPMVVKDQGRTLAGKIVLIGDGSLYEPQDNAIVPLLTERSAVPGIYLHACATYTLIKAPLYELTGLARLLADFTLALVILLSVTSARIYMQNRSERFAEKRATYFFLFVVTVVATLLGIVFLPHIRVMWDDFLFVIVALWIHPAVDGTLWQALSTLKTKIPSLMRALFGQETELGG
ncbi:MAG TPA: CHASE2 domain-containing protein [Pyrinomonadaceae bacterium]|nr:CHASE2 domain-containing protein [Pyrinomonadaceae bacterium]